MHACADGARAGVPRVHASGRCARRGVPDPWTALRSDKQCARPPADQHLGCFLMDLLENAAAFSNIQRSGQCGQAVPLVVLRLWSAAGGGAVQSPFLPTHPKKSSPPVHTWSVDKEHRSTRLCRERKVGRLPATVVHQASQHRHHQGVGGSRATQGRIRTGRGGIVKQSVGGGGGGGGGGQGAGVHWA